MITYDPVRKIYLEQNLGIPDVRRTLHFDFPVTGQDVANALKQLTSQGLALEHLDESVKSVDNIRLIESFRMKYHWEENVIADIDEEVTTKIGLSNYNKDAGILIRTDERLDNIGISLLNRYSKIGLGSTLWDGGEESIFASYNKLVERVSVACGLVEQIIKTTAASKTIEHIIPLTES